MGEILFSVVMATYGRGAHIVPSIRSALDQTLDAFELIVVGDACDDATEAAVAGFDPDKVRWDNLPSRWGSQSGPNNRGIALARGRHVAYLGHDDVWAPDHLEALARVFEETEADFAVSGTLFHMPPGIDRPHVTGLFGPEEAEAATRHFFPPSGLAHRREAAERVGGWRRPDAIRLPVDADFQLRAARAGLRFASTGRVTVHKFAAGHRYLSYLAQESHEQEAMRLRLKDPEHEAFTAEQVALARKHDRFMASPIRDDERLAPGQFARENAERKGNARPEPVELADGVLCPQRPGEFALDWMQEADVLGIRWGGQNPNPRWLVNVASDRRAFVCFALLHRSTQALGALDVTGPEAAVAELGPPVDLGGGLWAAPVCLRLRLSTRGPSVLQFHLTPAQAGAEGGNGLGLSDLTVIPESCGGTVALWLAQALVARVQHAAALRASEGALSPYRDRTAEAILGAGAPDPGIVGFVEGVEASRSGGAGTLVGWTADRADPEGRPLTVLAFAEGRFLAAAEPHGPRADVAAALGIAQTARVAFRLPLDGARPGAALAVHALASDGRHASLVFTNGLEPRCP